jgi:hypothetical protein
MESELSDLLRDGGQLGLEHTVALLVARCVVTTVLQIWNEMDQ